MVEALITALDLPTEVSVKLAQHASEEEGERKEKKPHSPKKPADKMAEDIVVEEPPMPKDKAVDPFWYGIYTSIQPAFKGTGMLVAFGSIFLAAKTLFHVFTDGASNALTTMAGSLPEMAFAVGVTGVLWFGGKAFFDAYKDAKEHNESLVNNIGQKLGLARARTHEKSGDEKLTAREQGIMEQGVIIGSLLGSQVGAAAVMEQVATEEAIAQAHTRSFVERALSGGRSQSVQDILAQGPRSLSAADIAEQLQTERDANPSLA